MLEPMCCQDLQSFFKVNIMLLWKFYVYLKSYLYMNMDLMFFDNYLNSLNSVPDSVLSLWWSF